MRQALGYSYNEIAAAENTTWRSTTEHQLARAKRLLRELDATAAADTAAHPAGDEYGLG